MCEEVFTKYSLLEIIHKFVYISIEEINEQVDRRTIYKYIEDLKELGIEVNTYEENEIGYALVTKK